jgi:hypothetical protein
MLHKFLLDTRAKVTTRWLGKIVKFSSEGVRVAGVGVPGG